MDKPFIQNIHNVSNNISKDKITDYSHLQTVSGKKSSCTREDINKVDTSRRIQEVIMFPSDAKFKRDIQNNCMTNTKVTVSDVNRTNDKYGPSDNMLKRKDTWSKSHSPQRILRIRVPPNIISAYKKYQIIH